MHRQPGFLVRVEQADLADLAQVHPDRVVGQFQAFEELFPLHLLAQPFILERVEVLFADLPLARIGKGILLAVGLVFDFDFVVAGGILGVEIHRFQFLRILRRFFGFTFRHQAPSIPGGRGGAAGLAPPRTPSDKVRSIPLQLIADPVDPFERIVPGFADILLLRRFRRILLHVHQVKPQIGQPAFQRPLAQPQRGLERLFERGRIAPMILHEGFPGLRHQFAQAFLGPRGKELFGVVLEQRLPDQIDQRRRTRSAEILGANSIQFQFAEGAVDPEEQLRRADEDSEVVGFVELGPRAAGLLPRAWLSCRGANPRRPAFRPCAGRAGERAFVHPQCPRHLLPVRIPLHLVAHILDQGQHARGDQWP